MITVEQAYALGPDGKVDMNLFQQFANQQQAMFTPQGGTGSSIGSPNLTLGQQYMAGNPDVQQDAIRRANAEGLTGGDAFSNRLDEIALEHYNNFGRAEGRTGYGYSAPAAGTFNPSPNDTPSFAPPLSSVGSGPRTNDPNFNNADSFGNLPPNSLTGSPIGSMNGQSQQPTYDFSGVNSQFQSALGNFGGLLDSFGSLTGGLLSGLQNNQTANAAYNPYQGYPNANYGAPNFQGYGGPNNMSSGWNAGSSWAGGNAGGSAGGAANTGHNMLWTV